MIERPADKPDQFGCEAAELRRRGNRLQVRLAKIEMALDGLNEIDRLLVLNQALTNVLHDSAGGR